MGVLSVSDGARWVSDGCQMRCSLVSLLPFQTFDCFLKVSRVPVRDQVGCMTAHRAYGRGGACVTSIWVVVLGLQFGIRLGLLALMFTGSRVH